MRTLQKVTILLLLTALLAVPCASAASPRSGKNIRAVPKATAAALLDHMEALLTQVWTKIGCHIDPDGVCRTAPAPTDEPQGQSDIGCHIDPNGQCHP